MSIKGTLETFNLCELLQMLAFNHKEGTLVLEAEAGTRSLYLDGGRLAFFEQDPGINASIERLVRGGEIAAGGQFDRALRRHEETGRGLLALLQDMGLVAEELAFELQKTAALEQLFEAQLTAVAGFEFVEGRALLGDGSDGHPSQPMLPVDGLLLDLARMLDQWNTVCEVIPGSGEIYEGTGIAVELGPESELDPELAAQVVGCIDGHRSLAQIAEECHTTSYEVTMVAAELFEEGGIRAVPTESLMARSEDLLACGEAARALPLLQRAIERGDAPPEARLRVADALEASGEPAEAAAELDTFAALSGDEDATSVFEALSRALKLRGGDFATAARVCDYYLRRRPWLQEYRSLANHALRDLIHGATTTGRPVDAALRLKGFIEAGDAPSEDLLLLADLFSAGGARQEAAAALYIRAEELIATDRVPSARGMLRRVLELDPGHADAHRRQTELEGARRRRGHRTRITMIVTLIALVGGTAGLAWWTFEDTSSTEISISHLDARDAVDLAEQRASAHIAAFAARCQAARVSGEHDETLERAAASLIRDVQAVMLEPTEQLQAYAAEIRRAEAAGYRPEHERRYEALAQRRHSVGARAQALVDEQAGHARDALKIALRSHKEGEFEEARQQLHAARNLAFRDPSTRSDATRLLGLVDEYYDQFESARDAMLEATENGELRLAFATGVDTLGELLDSDLTRKLPFPVRVQSEPAGAEVWLGGEDTGLRTPCVMTYTPFAEDPSVQLRLPGRTGVDARLPSYVQMRQRPDEARAWSPLIAGKLVPGPRWTVSDLQGPFAALWGSGSIPIAAGGRGRVVYAASPRDGALIPGARLKSTVDAIRYGGRLPGGLEWHIRGHRTFAVRPANGQGWETQAIGRLERIPLYTQGRLVLVDEMGTLYCYRASDGEPMWRVEIGGAPTQAPMVGAHGILMATMDGAVYRIDPVRGGVTPLAAKARGPAFALPLGEGAVLLGGGAGGCRFVAKDGTVTPRGDAQPAIDRLPWVGRAGVAWIEDDGVRWLGADATAPARIEGLGTSVDQVGGADGVLFGASPDGAMSAASLTKPETPLWRAPLGAAASTQPLVLGNAIYVLVDGRLVAVER
ncbi:MAG: DUF4388 domain-containing protein [Planctomycetota bacterium]|nr:DUF4388 domain-containing protein [Planctomycetota bacterium]